MSWTPPTPGDSLIDFVRSNLQRYRDLQLMRQHNSSTAAQEHHKPTPTINPQEGGAAEEGAASPVMSPSVSPSTSPLLVDAIDSIRAVRYIVLKTFVAQTTNAVVRGQTAAIGMAAPHAKRADKLSHVL